VVAERVQVQQLKTNRLTVFLDETVPYPVTNFTSKTQVRTQRRTATATTHAAERGRLMSDGTPSPM
jgi:hypothetical protein